LIIVALLIIVPFISFTVLARKAVDKLPNDTGFEKRRDKVLNYIYTKTPSYEQAGVIAKVRLLNENEINLAYEYVLYVVC